MVKDRVRKVKSEAASGNMISDVEFAINGKLHTVTANNLGPDSMLVDYIRDKAGLKGTKYMCREGGCGACVVSVKAKDPVTGETVTKAVNSCLTPIFGVDGWDIFTVESVGGKKEGYHKIQARLAKFNGTQCGFCSPGMVMSMHSLLETKGEVKVKDVEDNFDGNICRCTGYRPILDAFKSFAGDAPKELQQQCLDIEDCDKCPMKNGNGIASCPSIRKTKSAITMKLANGGEWIQAVDLDSVFSNLEKFKTEGITYRVVAGNTGTGVFKHDGPYDAYLGISGVPELSKSTIEKCSVILGGGVTLTSAISLLKQASTLNGYEYTAGMSKHLERVANVPVRNFGTLAGNLMMKYAHQDFQSDIFVLLDAVGAKLYIESSSKSCRIGSPKLTTMEEFLISNMNGRLIVSIHLPLLKGGYQFRSYKITRRYQNAHAYVNAAFLFKVDPKYDFKVLDKPRIVYGGISTTFSRAHMTENFLEGKCLLDENTLSGAMEKLDREINPDLRPAEATTQYRKSLTKSLLYKAILGIIGENVTQEIKSGGSDLLHGSSKGQQSFEADEKDSLLYKSVPKLEALAQVSGEAEYICDIPLHPGELFAACVLSTVANADLKAIDLSDALRIPGVVKFIQAKDVPGRNEFMKNNVMPVVTDEPIFVEKKISYAGQLLGLILAESRDIALAAVKKVVVTYENIQIPTIDMVEAWKKYEVEGTVAEHFVGTFPSKDQPTEEPKHFIKGEFQIGGQYHFHMETQSCFCIPKEDGMDVHSATQYMDQVQPIIAEALGVPSNNINVHVRRLGGSFGAKVLRSSIVAASCAVAAYVTSKPVRLILDLETNMKLIGKRLPYLMKYEVGFDDNGKIGRLNAQVIGDVGWAANEMIPMFALMHLQNVYSAVGWELKPAFVLTNTPVNTACRAPGTTEGIALIEMVMEHISHTLKKDPLEVRAANYLKTGDALIPAGVPFEAENLIPKIIEEIKVSGNYEERKSFIEKFNKENRWRKRGMSMIPVKYPIAYHGGQYQTQVVIYRSDGSVAVSHGGIEMGQGINTKVAQTVAHFLEIPLDKVVVKPSNNFIGANAFASGGSVASELCCDAAMKACNIIKERMKPVKEKLKNPTWEKLVEECHKASIDLTCSYLNSPHDGVKPYHVWLVNLTEVEVDILTGEYKILRSDLVEDAGKSLSPLIDIGQIEGGQIMGLGYWTSERIAYDNETGELLTCSTWDYKPPETKDIPEDNRITLLKNAPNPNGVLSSKATGEPSVCGSVSVLFALKNAISSARKDAGHPEWFRLDGPVNMEDVVRLSLSSRSDLFRL